MEATKISKKFTTREMGYGPSELKEVVASSKGAIDLFNVLALVSDTKVEQNRKDPTKTSTRFYGHFEVTDRLTGQVGTFPEAYLPGPAESFVAGQKAGSEGAVRLAFILTLEKDLTPNSAMGYKFGMKAMIDKKGESDPFKDMRDLLPAPDKKAEAAASKPEAGAKRR